MNTPQIINEKKTDTSLSLFSGERKKTKLFLFDMDGVLYDSMPNHVVAWQEAMKGFGLEMSADDVYATEGMRGVETIQTLVRQQQQRDIDEEEALEMYNEKARIFALLPESPVMDGVMDVMNKIQQAGIQTVIVTGSAQKPLLERLENDFRQFITADRIVSAFDVRKGKPAPDPYLMGLKKGGNIQPDEGVVVENAPMGVRSGVAAGIFTVAVNSGPLPDSALEHEGASLVFNSMPDFRDAWDSIFLKGR